MIAVIDYGAGNLFSVRNALDFLGIESEVTRDEKEIRKADGLILPGVGAFPDAMEMLSKYNFTKGFWGTNGISVSKGYSTPEIKEAMVKKYSMKNCKRCYILADASKFDQLSSVKFADFEQATILTTELYKPALKKYKNIVEVKE